MITPLLQQQTARRSTATSPAPSPSGDPWQWWTPQTIAAASQCPLDAVRDNWPLVYTALSRLGIADRPVCMAAIGTIAVETAHTFLPVEEAFWLSDAWRWANLRYAPHWGRGYVQLTWLSNYQRYSRFVSEILGRPIDLVANPALAMVPEIAAAVLAAYLVHHPTDDANLIPEAARRGDWREVRRLVQGGSAGLDELVACVNVLQAA